MSEARELYEYELSRKGDEIERLTLFLQGATVLGGKQIAEIERLNVQVAMLQETLQGIYAADWRKWEELASPEEFERWVKSRANHALRQTESDWLAAHDSNLRAESDGWQNRYDLKCNEFEKMQDFYEGREDVQFSTTEENYALRAERARNLESIIQGNSIIKRLQDEVLDASDSCRMSENIVDNLRDVNTAMLKERAELLEQKPFGVWHQGDTEDESDFHLGDNVSADDCEHCTALYAKPMPPAQEWQPIETAPKDGTRILICNSDYGSSVGYWICAEEDGCDCMGDDGGFVDIEYSTFKPARSFGNESHQYKGNQPTHWMPLPKATIAAAPKDK